jgi:hypothetical protein
MRGQERAGERSEKRMRRVIAIAMKSGVGEFVMADIMERDPLAQKVREGNPARMWVVTALSNDEIKALEHVEDVVLSADQSEATGPDRE